jgi:hypothetical protein
MRILNNFFSRYSIQSIFCVLLLSVSANVYAVSSNLVTAVQDSRGNLKVITWDVSTTSGNVTRKGSASAGAVNLVSAVGMAPYRFATALQDSRGDLKVIAWDVDDDGNVTRKGDASAGAIDLVAATSISLGSAADVITNRLVTAVKDSRGNLKVIMWDVDSSGNVARKGSASAGTVGLISVADMGLGRFATAVQDSSGNLKVIVWDVDNDGNVSRKGDASAGTISLVSIVTVEPRYTSDALGSRLATAVRDSRGDLKVIIWNVTGDGDVTRLGDASAGEIGLLSTANLTLTGAFVTAVQDSRGNLKVISWEVDRGGNVTRLGDASAGRIDLVAADQVATRTVTAVRDSDGNLKVISWSFRSRVLNRLGDASAGAIGLLSGKSIQP